MTAMITTRQQKQIERLMADALGNTNLDKEGAQRLIERGDQLKACLTQMLTKLDVETATQREVRKITGKRVGFPRRAGVGVGGLYATRWSLPPLPLTRGA